MAKDISNFYFTDDDYNTFHKDNATLNTSVIREQRKKVQEKLLDLNRELLYPKILQGGLNLAIHKNPEHITSLSYPCAFNNYRVDWLGIRYGRNSRDIQDLEEIINSLPNYQRTAEDKKLGFQKYACLQVNICYSGIEIGIFHSVPNYAVDRMYMHEHLDDVDLQDKIIAEIKELQGYGYVWNIGNEQENHTFDLDNEKADDFISFYRKYDKDGMWSSMLKHFPRYDEKINNANLLNTCYNIIEQLKPLYELVIWKRGNN